MFQAHSQTETAVQSSLRSCTEPSTSSAALYLQSFAENLGAQDTGAEVTLVSEIMDTHRKLGRLIQSLISENQTLTENLATKNQLIHELEDKIQHDSSVHEVLLYLYHLILFFSDFIYLHCYYFYYIYFRSANLPAN